MSWIIIKEGNPPLYWTGEEWSPCKIHARGYAYRGDPLLESLRLGGVVRFRDATAWEPKRNRQ